MERRVAVEEGLSPIREYLQQKGYKVVDMKSVAQADAAVISGGDKNFMNMQDAMTDAPVISAQGLTPEDVLKQLESKWLH
ncbi:YkuS family protein [Dethiobacter alkaliphilus]|uniref:YkuS family protein n=1 Tax=Dethiobacter alkaliphilus TaxID=427926 RepID=UPI002227A086|nr:YkuS family protein [Dethiobacter alkaliphilus]MCW3488962.1 YkuS family protein [Dethiobacter alkaliphilus]